GDELFRCPAFTCLDHDPAAVAHIASSRPADGHVAHARTPLAQQLRSDGRHRRPHATARAYYLCLSRFKRSARRRSFWRSESCFARSWGKAGYGEAVDPANTKRARGALAPNTTVSTRWKEWAGASPSTSAVTRERIRQIEQRRCGS